MEPAVAAVVELYKAVHQALRNTIVDFDAEALAWSPGPETNPTSVLIVHTLGSEAEVLRLVRGLPHDRDRDAEFVVRTATAADLTARLDAADALLDEHGPAITTEDLDATRERRRERAGTTTQSGLAWLVSNYGHAREHLAHVQLTKQLYAQRGASA